MFPTRHCRKQASWRCASPRVASNTHRWSLDQAREAYELFDAQSAGKGVFER